MIDNPREDRHRSLARSAIISIISIIQPPFFHPHPFLISSFRPVRSTSIFPATAAVGHVAPRYRAKELDKPPARIRKLEREREREIEREPKSRGCGTTRPRGKPTVSTANGARLISWAIHLNDRAKASSSFHAGASYTRAVHTHNIDAPRVGVSHVSATCSHMYVYARTPRADLGNVSTAQKHNAPVFATVDAERAAMRACRRSAASRHCCVMPRADEEASVNCSTLAITKRARARAGLI